ncbi:MAG TPA: hypothetical protein V6D30_03560 [Leptolyngbyaceae cyanobacterium]
MVVLVHHMQALSQRDEYTTPVESGSTSARYHFPQCVNGIEKPGVFAIVFISTYPLSLQLWRLPKCL